MTNQTAVNNIPASDDCQPQKQYSSAQTLLNNIPYIAMTMLGSAILALGLADSVWAWIASIGFLLYGAVGALWIMVFVCPYCRYWNTRACPCGYGIIAAKLRNRQAYDRFAEKFRKHIPVIVPLWFIPLLAGIYSLIRAFSWPLLVLLVLFAIDAFVILPMLSKKHGCADCPQKDTCPWMGGRNVKSAAASQA